MDKSNKTTFIYMGDPQCSRIRGRDNDYSQWGQLLRRALVMQRQEGPGNAAGKSEADAERSTLLVLGGDLVNRKDDHAAWDAFFDAAAGIARPMQMASVVTGSEESIGSYADRFLNPANGPAGHEKEFFSFDYGCCHFLFLDSDYMGNRSRDAYKYIGAWIKADLAINRQPATFAVMHHPVYTVGTSYDDDVRAAAVRENYMKLLYRYGVDMILCGHQHVYARSKAQADEEAGRYEITQIMGVSGTKYFDAWNKSAMACVRENISVATLFETDGEAIRLKTIDQTGTVIDAYSQEARAPKKRKCASCEHFRECGGTGAFEKREAERKALAGHDPLKPENKEGIRVVIRGGDGGEPAQSESRLFSDESLGKLEQIEERYSVMRRGKRTYETWRGFRLRQLLELAGLDISSAAGATLLLTNSKGHQKALPLEQSLTAWRFEDGADEDGADNVSNATKSVKYVVPTIISRDDGTYRLITGQQSANEYNGRGWMADIRQIDVF